MDAGQAAAPLALMGLGIAICFDAALAPVDGREARGHLTTLARWFVRTKDVDTYVVVTDLLDLIDRAWISADRLAASPAREVAPG